MKNLTILALTLLSSCGSGTNSIPKDGAATATQETPQTVVTGSTVTVTLRAMQNTRISDDAVTVSDNRVFTVPSVVQVDSGIPYCMGANGPYACPNAPVTRRARLLIGGATCEYLAQGTGDTFLSLTGCASAVINAPNNIDSGTVIQLQNYDVYNQIISVTFQLESR